MERQCRVWFSQPTKELNRGLRIARSASRCPSVLVAIPLFYRIAGLSNRHLELLRMIVLTLTSFPSRSSTFIRPIFCIRLPQHSWHRHTEVPNKHPHLASSPYPVGPSASSSNSPTGPKRRKVLYEKDPYSNILISCTIYILLHIKWLKMKWTRRVACVGQAINAAFYSSELNFVPAVGISKHASSSNGCNYCC
jgi:hypothetical protein